MGGSASHINLRFATISLGLVFLIAALAALASMLLVQRSEEDGAVRDATQFVAAPLSSLVAPLVTGAPAPFGSDARTQADAVAAPFLASGVRAVRIWSPDGTQIYSTGVDAGPGEAKVPRSGVLSRRTKAADGTSLFVTYVANGTFTIEVADAASSVDGRVRAQQRNALIIDAAAGVVVFLLLQAGFWLATRGIARDHRRLVHLYVTGEGLRRSLDIHDVITRIAQEATAVTRGDFGLVALYEQETGDLLLRATYDHSSGNITHHQRAVEEWFLRRSVATNTTIVSAQNATAYHQFFGPDMDLEGQVNVLCAPMCIRDRVVGVIAVIKRPAGRNGGFQPHDIRESVDIAVQGAMAIEQSQLFAKVRAYADEVELSYDATLKALMAALDAKDDVTEGHAERTTRLTMHLAKQLGMPESSLVDIERGAMLHDVGKIGVPDAVLKKPAALDDMEWEAIRKHPLLAGMMISKVGFLEGATPILLYHHERFDGTGYPFGLRSDKIPLEARLFSVVDAYDAMTSHRPYRDAMPHTYAMDEIHAGSGTQFDPTIVEAFEHLMTTHPELRSRNVAVRETLHTDTIAATSQDASSAA
jgi:HD-GYP domain-containing protein (c-di-GMP phosphodiesterase class II)